MPLNVMPPIKKKYFLSEETDPDQETFVIITQGRHDADITRDVMIASRSHPKQLQYWELWSTYVDTNILFDGKKMFPDREKLTEIEFYDLIGQLPSDVVYDWQMLVWEHNPDWMPPMLIGSGESKNSEKPEDTETSSEPQSETTTEPSTSTDKD